MSKYLKVVMEMEVSAMTAYGTSSFLKERLRDCSDPFVMFICSHCHQLSNSTETCSTCKVKSVKPTQTSYVFNLLMHELRGLGLAVKCKVGC